MVQSNNNIENTSICTICSLHEQEKTSKGDQMKNLFRLPRNGCADK